MANCVNGPKNTMDTGNVQFGKGTLKDIEVEAKRVKNSDGIFEQYKVYRATLTDGTVVKYREQGNWNDEARQSIKPQIVKNSDGSIDFINLSKAIIDETEKNDQYFLIGCVGTQVNASEYSDKDTIDFANLKTEDGQILQNEKCVVFFNKGSHVGSIIDPTKFQEYMPNSGYRLSISSGEETTYTHEKYQRSKEVTVDKNNHKTVQYFAKDGKKLNNAYAEGIEKIFAGGYKTVTSRDGKQIWYVAPDGKLLTKEEFEKKVL